MSVGHHGRICRPSASIRRAHTPFFSVPRSSVTAFGHTGNVKNLPASGVVVPVLRRLAYINSLQCALSTTADGVLKSVQNLIRGKHLRLVAEIRFGHRSRLGEQREPEPAHLLIVESDNPVPEDSHTIAHTFELK